MAAQQYLMSEQQNYNQFMGASGQNESNTQGYISPTSMPPTSMMTNQIINDSLAPKTRRTPSLIPVCRVRDKLKLFERRHYSQVDRNIKNTYENI